MAIRQKGPALRAMCVKLRSFLATSLSEVEICNNLEISWADYEILKAKMIELESKKVMSQPSENVYVEYLMNQEKNVVALTKMIDTFETSKQHAAMVGAVKARADIYDKMIKVGQEFGFVDKVPEKTEVVAGVLIRELQDDDLRTQIAKAVSNLDGLVNKYDGKATIVDIDPGQTHFPDPTPSKLLSSTVDGEVKENNKSQEGETI